MAEIDTGKLTPEQRKEATTTKEGAMSDDKEPTKALPEPYRSILLLVMAGVGMFGGGAAGQSVFGISEAKLDQVMEQKFSEQDKAIEAKFEILKAQDAGKQLIITSNSTDIRELKAVIRDVEKRLIKLEAGK